MPHDDKECQKQLEQLEQENRLLRQSAEQFGELADRLNNALRAERRAGADRRQAARKDERRQDTFPNRSA
jgi:hypothetical protein